jgi:hypothetical protein
LSTGHRSHRALFDNTFDRLHYEGAHQVPPELYAAAGYLVLMVNPRGDPSYSPAYQEALREGWVAPTRYDILSGVDEVIRLGYADSTRLGIAVADSRVPQHAASLAPCAAAAESHQARNTSGASEVAHGCAGPISALRFAVPGPTIDS